MMSAPEGSTPTGSAPIHPPSHGRADVAEVGAEVFAPGTTVKVRDEEWLVESSSQDGDLTWLTVRGLRGLVQDTVATFSPQLDSIERSSPKDTKVIADDSPHYRRARLWLEAVLRKTPEPIRSTEITLADQGLADPLSYQLEAVRKAISDQNPRCRILLADAVGLGKTIEIGMILSELARRGKGERILIVTPRHVLEQTQLELWSRFGLPFVRLDSAGIQRVRQKIPATRNPFTYYPRAIVSIDTLKSDQYAHQIGSQHWDAVVIDESHNLSNVETLNNRLARTLAANTDALILASATPHNGRAESFAELIRLLDPTAITPDGKLIPEEVDRLVVRRHRHSPAVASEVGADWAERAEPVQILIEPSPAEDTLATELAETWLHPEGGKSPVTDARGAEALFPWTLAKAFLSSPAALLETVRSRKRRAADAGKLGPEEAAALDRLELLAADAEGSSSGKFDHLVDYLKDIGVKRGSETRAVVFAERVATLHWLAERLPKALGMPKNAFEVLHGSVGDIEQQRIVDEFSRKASPLRVLITSDVASEGVNLHMQCHHLIHYDLPWSLIRIEQRNGRIDRYGQRHSPQIAMMVLSPSHPQFSGDIRVLTALMEREHEAHRALGESSSLMGKYSVSAEEEEIKRVLAGRKPLDEAMLEPAQVVDEGDQVGALFAQLFGTPGPQASGPSQADPFATGLPSAGFPTADGPTTGGPALDGPGSDGRGPDDSRGGVLYSSQLEFLQEALAEVFASPGQQHPQGVGFTYDKDHGIAHLTPPADLAQRLEVLPQSFLKDRRVTERLKLATTRLQGEARMKAARADKDGSSWPDASYLAPLHPVLEWATDRSLSSLGRGEIFAVRGDVEIPTVLVLATLMNAAGASAAAAWAGVHFPDLSNPEFNWVQPYESAAEAIATYNWQAMKSNIGPVANVAALQGLIPQAVDAAERWASTWFGAVQDLVLQEQEEWAQRSERWQEEAAGFTQRKEVRARRKAAQEQAAYLQGLAPSRRLVRPIMVVVPQDWPVAEEDSNAVA